MVDGAIDTTSTSSNCIYRVLVEREIDVRCVEYLCNNSQQGISQCQGVSDVLTDVPTYN